MFSLDSLVLAIFLQIDVFRSSQCLKMAFLNKFSTINDNFLWSKDNFGQFWHILTELLRYVYNGKVDIFEEIWF